MARKTRRAKAQEKNAKARKRPEKSVLTKGQFYLSPHDEEKLLLFVTGIVFGVGLSVTMLQKFLFGGIVALVVGLVLLLIENNQKYHK